jgi:hypothetical protein
MELNMARPQEMLRISGTAPFQAFTFPSLCSNTSDSWKVLDVGAWAKGVCVSQPPYVMSCTTYNLV